jgi:hypothetical protein
LRPICVGGQIGLVPAGGAHRPPHRLPLRHRARGVMPLGLQRRDDGVGLACQPWRQVRAYPRQALGLGLPQPGVGRGPQLCRGMDEVQHAGVPRTMGHDLRRQRLGAIGARHTRLDGGPLALGDPPRQTAHGVRLPGQGGAQFCADGLGAGHGRRPLGVWPPRRHHLLRGALVRGPGGEPCDDGLLLLGALLPLAQAQAWRLGGWLHHGYPLAIGVPHEDGADGGGGRRVGWLRLTGGPILSRGRHTGFEGWDTAGQPQDAFASRLALAVGLVGRPISRPLPQQVSRAAGRQAQVRVQRAAPLRAGGGEVLPPKAHVANDGIVGGRALLVIRQARAVGGSHRRRRAHGRPRDQEPPQQRRPQGQPPPEEGQFHRLGRLRPRVGAWDVSQQVLKRVLQWLSHRLWVGSHRGAPVAHRGVELPMIAQGAMAFNSWRAPNSHSDHVPRILVTLI